MMAASSATCTGLWKGRTTMEVPMRAWVVLAATAPHEGEDAGEDAVAGEVVLSEPDVLDAESVGELDLLEGVGDGVLSRDVLVPSDGVEHSESHGGSPYL